MKKNILKLTLFVVVIAMASCGASRKTGCPTVAYNYTASSLIAS
jgi:hypothetical protein